MKGVVAFIFFVMFVFWFGNRAYQSIQFDQNCGGYLKRAADANTVDMAQKQLEIALKYIKYKGLTYGYTSILWNTPDEDIGFWYKNLESANEELLKVADDATQLEKTNVLMKLRETLLDQGQNTSVTIPDGISRYPNNGTWAVSGFFIIFLMIIFMVIWMED